MDKPLVEKAELEYDGDTGLAVPMIAVWMVFLTLFMDTLAATISTPVLPYYAKEFGASNASIGYLFAAWSFTSAFCAPMLGRLSDRIGRQKVLLISLIGAGIANLGQASAPSYWALFCWRAFSGVWAAVQSTAQVYMADVCTPAVLPDYMAQLSSVPAAAMTFGPGLGGGLSRFGLNVPILVDGVVTLSAAVLVFIYLPESPIWVPPSRVNAEENGTPKSSSRGSVDKTPVPGTVYVLGISSFLWGCSFGTRVSMQVVSLMAKLDFDPLDVGYLYATFAIMMLCQNTWLTPWMQRRFGIFTVAIVGTLMFAFCSLAAFGATSSQWPCLALLVAANCGTSARMATQGTISALFADNTNRGAVFAQVQMMMNLGRMIGPLVGGHLAVRDPIVMPWIWAGSCSLVSTIILCAIVPKEDLVVTDFPQRRPSLLGSFDTMECEGALDPEVGSAEDYERVGRHVCDLLRERNYRWVSRQSGVLRMLDQLLPPLRAGGKEQLEDMELLVKHVQLLQADFGKLGEGRQM